MLRNRPVLGQKAASRLFSRLAADCDAVWVATAWASRPRTASDELWKARGRIERLVVGLDFHGTSPSFLRKFRPWVRVPLRHSGTFHPKVYVFRQGSRFDAMIGSSNFTVGGFEENIEANLHISGDVRDEFFGRLVEFIQGIPATEIPLTRDEIREYESGFTAWRSARRHLPRYPAHRSTVLSTKPSANPVALQVGWAEYIRLLKRSTRMSHDLFHRTDRRSYLDVIADIRTLLRSKPVLATMSATELEQVGGLRKGRFGYFGSLIGAGRFKHALRDTPWKFDRALSRIPAELSTVAERDFRLFVQDLPRGLGFGGVSGPSRLLAMKRPDRFICLNKRNRAGIADSFGITTARLMTLDGYWDLHTLLWKCPWFRALRPTGVEGEIWDSRVALVDAIFYDD